METFMTTKKIDQDQLNDGIPSPDLIVGNNIRKIRNRKKLSLRQLSEESGLNINTLSLIENGKSSPSVSTLQCLARALYVPITSFFEPETVKTQVAITRHDQRTSTAINNALMQNLAKDYFSNAVQPFVVTLEPGGGSGSQEIVHSGHEMVYCLAGSVRYRVGDEVFDLFQDDSIVFAAHLPHSWKNLTDETAKILLILCREDEMGSPGVQHFR